MSTVPAGATPETYTPRPSFRIMLVLTPVVLLMTALKWISPLGFAPSAFWRAKNPNKTAPAAIRATISTLIFPDILTSFGIFQIGKSFLYFPGRIVFGEGSSSPPKDSLLGFPASMLDQQHSDT